MTSKRLMGIALAGLVTASLAALPAWTARDSARAARAADTSGNGAVSMLDQRFVVGTALGGMMEVDLGQLAQQRAASDAVRSFAARMVRDHQQANTELMSLASNKGIRIPRMAMDGGAVGAAGGDDRRANGDQDRGNAGDDRRGNGGDGDRNGTGNRDRNPGNPNGAGAGDGAGRAGDGAGSGTGALDRDRAARNAAGDFRVDEGRRMGELGSLGLRHLMVEHQDERTVLSGLSGSDFDLAYMGDQVKMHAKTLADFELHARASQDADIRSFAARNQRLIRDHYQTARQIANSMTDRESRNR